MWSGIRMEIGFWPLRVISKLSSMIFGIQFSLVYSSLMIRTMREVQSFKGHKKEVTALAWHPIHEDLFARFVASFQFSGTNLQWWKWWHPSVLEYQRFIANVWYCWCPWKYCMIDFLFSGIHREVTSLGWHPMGHILASGSADHNAKFWTRQTPGMLRPLFTVFTGRR